MSHDEKLFDVIESQIKSTHNDSIIPDRKALYVNNKCVNIVSNSRYKVVQPKEIYNRFQQASHLEITKLVTNPNYGSLLLSASYGKISVGNDQHDLNLSFYTGHNNQYSTFTTLMGMRQACMNQLPAMIGAPSLYLMKCKHIQDFNFEELESIIETLPRRVANFQLQCQRLQESKLSFRDFLEAYVSFFKLEESAKKDKAIASITDVYKKAQGQEIITDDTAYKAFHALTYDLTHNVKQTKNQLEKVNVQNQKIVYKFFDFLKDKELLAA